MKEVKLVALTELVRGGSWGRELNVQDDRPVVEEGLAELLNEGWQIAGTGGEILSKAFVILVRENS
jgi:hypothetical protein